MRSNIVTYDCPCDEGKHDINLKYVEARMLHDFVLAHGLDITVTVTGKGTWRVPRIYIYKHGLKGKDIETLGFEKVVE